MRKTRLWFERRFAFDLPLDSYANVVERLRDAPARSEWRLRSADPAAILKRGKQAKKCRVRQAGRGANAPKRGQPVVREMLDNFKAAIQRPYAFRSSVLWHDLPVHLVNRTLALPTTIWNHWSSNREEPAFSACRSTRLT